MRLAVWTPIPGAAAGLSNRRRGAWKAVRNDSCIGILLAGGLARRMGGGDKPLKKLGGIPLLDHARLALRPQCNGLLLSANGDPERFSQFGLPVVADDLPEAGPLAGILAALDWISAHCRDTAFAVSTPADTPFLPRDLVARLQAGLQGGASIVCANSGSRLHPAVALWPVTLRGELRRALVDDNLRKVETFVRNYSPAIVAWPIEPYDPFFNVNEPKDLQTAEAILAIHKRAIAPIEIQY